MMRMVSVLAMKPARMAMMVIMMLRLMIKKTFQGHCYFLRPALYHNEHRASSCSIVTVLAVVGLAAVLSLAALAVNLNRKLVNFYL